MTTTIKIKTAIGRVYTRPEDAELDRSKLSRLVDSIGEDVKFEVEPDGNCWVVKATVDVPDCVDRRGREFAEGYAAQELADALALALLRNL